MNDNIRFIIKITTVNFDFYLETLDRSTYQITEDLIVSRMYYFGAEFYILTLCKDNILTYLPTYYKDIYLLCVKTVDKTLLIKMD